MFILFIIVWGCLSPVVCFCVSVITSRLVHTAGSPLLLRGLNDIRQTMKHMESKGNRMVYEKIQPGHNRILQNFGSRKTSWDAPYMDKASMKFESLQNASASPICTRLHHYKIQDNPTLVLIYTLLEPPCLTTWAQVFLTPWRYHLLLPEERNRVTHSR